MYRSEFMPISFNSGISERDMLMSCFRDYVFKRPMLNYKLQYDDYMRPDKISLKAYGKKDYWWIILRSNPKFEDVWNDFVVGGITIEVLNSNIDKSIPTSAAEYVSVDKAEYMYPDAYKVGEFIKIPNLLDIQDLYSFAKSRNR
jgi:hypothetical protein